MLPIVEMARSHRYIPEQPYFYEPRAEEAKSPSSGAPPDPPTFGFSKRHVSAIVTDGRYSLSGR